MRRRWPIIVEFWRAKVVSSLGDAFLPRLVNCKPPHRMPAFAPGRVEFAATQEPFFALRESLGRSKDLSKLPRPMTRLRLRKDPLIEAEDIDAVGAMRGVFLDGGILLHLLSDKTCVLVRLFIHRIQPESRSHPLVCFRVRGKQFIRRLPVHSCHSIGPRLNQSIVGFPFAESCGEAKRSRLLAATLNIRARIEQQLQDSQVRLSYRTMERPSPRLRVTVIHIRACSNENVDHRNIAFLNGNLKGSQIGGEAVDIRAAFDHRLYIIMLRPMHQAVKPFHIASVSG